MFSIGGWGGQSNGISTAIKDVLRDNHGNPAIRTGSHNGYHDSAYNAWKENIKTIQNFEDWLQDVHNCKWDNNAGTREDCEFGGAAPNNLAEGGICAKLDARLLHRWVCDQRVWTWNSSDREQLMQRLSSRLGGGQVEHNIMAILEPIWNAHFLENTNSSVYNQMRHLRMTLSSDEYVLAKHKSIWETLYPRMDMPNATAVPQRRDFVNTR